MTELKSCAFCGSTNCSLSLRAGAWKFAYCPDCLTEGPAMDNDSDAIAAWNRRAASASTSEVAQAPVAWVRYRSDGGFEGPIMDTDARMCDTRRSFWTPLYAAPVAPTPETVKPQALTDYDADMVWPDDDGESMFHTIDDAVDYVVDMNWPDTASLEVQFQIAKRIPTAKVRIFNITENGHEWEVVPAAALAASSNGERGESA